MNRDRLTLLALISAFTLVAACELPWENEKEEKRLPDRAPAANGLLRHYYDTLTFPYEMTNIKIPEGDKFDEKEIKLNFPMGGGEVIDDVRIRLYVLPSGDLQEGFPDVQAKVIAPDGTASAWTEVSFISGTGDAKIVDLNAELHFANEFDGVDSDGDWEIQLRDPIRDEDGRCILRNATLRLNLGLPGGGTAGTETQTVALIDGPYGARLPELEAPRVKFDLGYIGTNKPLRFTFTFATSFNVQAFQLTWNIRSKLGGDASQDVFFYIISPSGGWWCPSTEAIAAASSLDDPSGGTTDKYSNFIFSMDRATIGIGDRFPFLGEPSAGDWVVLFFDNKKDGIGHFYTDVDGVAPGALIELQLS